MSKCQKCNNTGMCDSGGSTPWGEPIFIECDCLMKDDESRCQFEESWLRRGGLQTLSVTLKITMKLAVVILVVNT
ncbi:hypothetical protein G708_02324 [Escherichia coli HVH 32 (4-3773988)]|nr:hypothetical protein G708_02324 [Escherichia coli HVH 32 (4-3773988)]